MNIHATTLRHSVRKNRTITTLAATLTLLIGAVAASSACYGFIYLGGLSGVLEVAGQQKSRASAGFFLMAYIGFSLPVITTGAMVDAFGHAIALQVFGGTLLGAVVVVSWVLKSTRRVHESLPAR